MTHWLGRQIGVLARDESRRLLTVHRALDEVDRMAALARERETLLPVLRQLVLAPRDGERLADVRLLVEKEPLERIALPDGRLDAFLRHAREPLPDLRLVFMLRHPVATVSSMCARRWGYSLASGDIRDITVDEAIDTWRAAAAQAHALRHDPAVLCCRYEQLVADPIHNGAAIARHLQLSPPSPFVPRAARPSGLDTAAEARVMARTVAERAWFGM